MFQILNQQGVHHIKGYFDLLHTTRDLNVLPSMNAQNERYQNFWNMMPTSEVETITFHPEGGSRMFSGAKLCVKFHDTNVGTESYYWNDIYPSDLGSDS
jgi:hypothetical protein